MSKANNVTVDFDHANTTASHVVVDTLQQQKNSMPDQAEKPDKIQTMKKSLILTIDDIPKDERDFDNSMIYLTKKYLKDLPFIHLTRSSITIDLEAKTPDESTILPKRSVIDQIIRHTESLQAQEATTSAPTPTLPKRQLIITGVLLAIGIICVAAGIVYAVKTKTPSTGITFWSVGAICLLPGIFYGKKFCHAVIGKDSQRKIRAIEEIPQ